MAQARADWVIRPDIDEVLNSEVQESIILVTREPRPGINGYFFLLILIHLW